MQSRDSQSKRTWHLPATGPFLFLFAGVLIFAPLAGAAPVSESHENVVFVDSEGNVHVVDPDNPGKYATPSEALTLYGRVEGAKSPGILFRVWFYDVLNHTNIGFDDPGLGAQRRACVGRVLDYLNSIFNESGTCDISFGAVRQDAARRAGRMPGARRWNDVRNNLNGGKITWTASTRVNIV